MSEIDQQFIEYVVKSLVGKPDAVHVDRRIDEKGVLLELTVDPEDLGRVIGKRGATAQSLRTLLRALGTKNDARYNLKIIDNGVEGGSHSHQPHDQGTSSSSDDSYSSSDDSGVADDSVSQPEPDEPEKEPAKENEEDQASERLRQTRAELADLDDLDV
jgi:predicted RNA-binding protein YlqC (UPF0109 family)